MQQMKHLLILAILAPALATQLPAVVLVNETFSDNNRSGNNLPDSLDWHYGAHNSTSANAFTELSITPGSGSLTWDHTNGSGVSSYSAIWGHFTPSGSPLTIEEGEQLKLSFNVTFSGGDFVTGAGNFRWALLNSNGSRISTDFAGNNATGIASGSTFSGWRGYEGQTAVHNTSPGSNSLLTRERTTNGNGLFTSSSWNALSGSSKTAPITSAGSSLLVTLELTRTAGGMQVLASYGGISTVLVLDDTPVTAFDTISFFTLDGGTQDITLSNIQLELTTIPEPTTTMVGALGLAGCLIRRRRNA